MRIGIDGGALSITDTRLKTGVYRVAYNLVKEMQALYAKNDYRIYTFGRGEQAKLDLSDPNTHFVTLPQSGFHAIWQMVDVVRHPVDVYLGISQAVPFFPTILCDVRKIGFIYDVGFLEHPEFYPDSFRALHRQTAALIRRSDHIITISQASKAAIREAYGVPEERVSVSYLGVSPAFTSDGAKSKHPRPYFLFAGSLKKGKNIPFMLRAFADYLKESDTLYDFVLVGSDYWRDTEISSTITELGLDHRVIIRGFLPDDELASWYRGAVALVTVSLIEGFGMPAIEAMACGCPVIAASGGSYEEVVGNAGMLIDPHDRLGLIAALRTVAADNAIRTNLVRAGRKQATKFTWRTFARSVLTAAHASAHSV